MSVRPNASVSQRPLSTSFSDSDHDDIADKNAPPALPPGIVAPPPFGAHESRMWQHMNEVLPDKSAMISVRGVDFGSHRYQLLHHEIDDIVRTKGRMNHTELVCLENPASRDETPLSPRAPGEQAGGATVGGAGGGVAKKVSPTNKSGKHVLHPRKQRFLAMKTVPYENYIPSVFAKGPGGKGSFGGGGGESTFASFRFSFITLFFVGVACGKFKRLLRRRTLAEQQERYGEMLSKSVAARLEHINKPEAKNYNVRSARDLVQRTTREGTAKFNLAIKTSNDMARRVKLNPRATSLSARMAGGGDNDFLQQSLPTVTPSATLRLGEFLVNNVNGHGVNPNAFITATNAIHRSGSLEGTSAHVDGIVPVLETSQLMGSPFSMTSRSRQAAMTQSPAGAIVSGGNHHSPRAPRGGASTTLEHSPRFGSFFREEAPSLSTTARVIPAFELFSDVNVFVANLQWDEMEYVPLSERSKKTLVLQRQVKESDLTKFTQTAIPASSKRIQEESTGTSTSGPLKKLPGEPMPVPPPSGAASSPRGVVVSGANADDHNVGGGDHSYSKQQHQLGSVSSHSSFARLPHHQHHHQQTISEAQQHAMVHLLSLQQANLDVDLKHAAIYEPGKRSTARSDAAISGIRATRSIARPDASVPFNFYSWRTKQNRALFHHLCQEHRELMMETAAAVAGSVAGNMPSNAHHNTTSNGGYEFNASANAAFAGESPADGQLVIANKRAQQQQPNGGGLTQKELQALRERVRRRAEEVEFNDRDSASTTYSAFLVHKNVEHVDFLKRSMAEVERLLATKEALSRVPKRAQLLQSIDQQNESGAFLAERFVESLSQLEDGIRLNLKKSIIEENAVYNRGWVLTLRGRLQMSFGGDLPPELRRVMALAEQTVTRCSHRDLTLKDLEEGVVQELSDIEAMSPAAQFGLERLLPAFSSTEKAQPHATQPTFDPFAAQPPVPIGGGGPVNAEALPPAVITPKDVLRRMFGKIKIPFVLLSEEDEKEHKELFGLSAADKTRYTNWKELRSIGQLNTIMEPHFDKLALAALNSVEARHTVMRMEHRKMLEQMGKAEESALMKAASLERRGTTTMKRLSIAVGGADGGGDPSSPSGRRRSSSVVMYPMPLGVDSISPTNEKARAMRRESFATNSDTGSSTASPRKASVAPSRAGSTSNSSGNFFAKSDAPKLPALATPQAQAQQERRSSRVVTMVPHAPPPLNINTTQGNSPSKRAAAQHRQFHSPTGVSPVPVVVAERV